MNHKLNPWRRKQIELRKFLVLVCIAKGNPVNIMLVTKMIIIFDSCKCFVVVVGGTHLSCSEMNRSRGAHFLYQNITLETFQDCKNACLSDNKCLYAQFNETGSIAGWDKVFKVNCYTHFHWLLGGVCDMKSEYFNSIEDAPGFHIFYKYCSKFYKWYL